MRVDLAKHSLLFSDIHFVWSETLATKANDPLKPNNEINAFLNNPKII